MVTLDELYMSNLINIYIDEKNRTRINKYIRIHTFMCVMKSVQSNRKFIDMYILSNELISTCPINNCKHFLR